MNYRIGAGTLLLLLLAVTACGVGDDTQVGVQTDARPQTDTNEVEGDPPTSSPQATVPDVESAEVVAAREAAPQSVADVLDRAGHSSDVNGCYELVFDRSGAELPVDTAAREAALLELSPTAQAGFAECRMEMEKAA